MKVLVALSILAVLQTAPAISHKSTKQALPRAEQSIAPEKTTTPIQTAEHPAVKSKEHVVVEKLPEKDAWDKAAIVLTGLLALIGVLTLGAVWYQAVQTKGATKAMERSTGITVEIERGRIVSLWDQVIHINLSPSGIHDGR